MLLACLGSADTTYTVRKGDTISDIAERTGVSQKTILGANRLSSPHRLKLGLKLRIPSKGVRVAGASTASSASRYTVRKGDNDWTIAKRLGTTASIIRRLNPGINWTRIQPGQILNGPATRPLAVAKPKATGKVAKKAASKKLVAKASPKKTVAALPASEGFTTVVSSRKRKDGSAEQLISNARSFRGVRYRWGGTSRGGTDCSGFTLQVFRSMGIKLPRTSIEQAKVGKAVAKGDLKAGDLVFFRTSRSSRINHVGIYVANGTFIHASSGGGRVMESSLKEGYYTRCYATARRVGQFSAAKLMAVVEDPATAPEIEKAPPTGSGAEGAAGGAN